MNYPATWEKKLDKFFADNTCMSVDRSTYLHCDLEDPEHRITVNLIFISNWHKDYNSYEEILMQGTGAVFIFPAYWVCVEKKLRMSYFSYILDQFYATNVAEWNVGFTPNDSSDCGCPC